MSLRHGLIDVCGFVFSRYSMYIAGFPLVFVATLPSLPFLNEAGRVAASAPAVGGHRVNPGWLPLSLRLPSLSLLCLWAADGSRRCTRGR